MMTVINNKFEPQWILIQGMISCLGFDVNCVDGPMINCNGFDVKCDSAYVGRKLLQHRHTSQLQQMGISNSSMYIKDIKAAVKRDITTLINKASIRKRQEKINKVNKENSSSMSKTSSSHDTHHSPTKKQKRSQSKKGIRIKQQLRKLPIRADMKYAFVKKKKKR